MPKRIFILALDGTPYSLLQRFAGEGIMPNLKQLITAANFRPMNSVLPSVSSVAWSSFMTGKSPFKHGIFGFIERMPKTMDVYVPTSEHQRGQTLWEYLSELGKRVFVMNVPVTYPPRRLNGILIGGFLGSNILTNTWPPAIGRELADRGYRIDVDTIRARQDLQGFIKELWLVFEKRIEILWHYYQQEKWDFFMAHIMETDRLHHFLWEYMENGQTPYIDIFIDFYRLIDRLIGKIKDRLPADMTLLLLSDHGFTSLKKEVYINKWLFDQGYLKFTSAEGPDSLHQLHPQSIAYSLIPGRIYLNRKGREKNGWLQDSLMIEKLRWELKEALMDLTDNQSGEKMIRAVLTAEQLMAGQGIVNLNGTNDSLNWPDLLIHPQDGYDFKGNLWRQHLTEKGPIVGTHSLEDAFVLIEGHQLTRQTFSITDMLPTILQLLEVPLMDDLDGQSVLINNNWPQNVT